MSMVKRSTHDHDCYEHYELKSYEKLFSCDGCKMKGFGPRYICNLCGHELHTECRFPNNSITHENFPGSTFFFQENPFTRHNGKSGRKEYSKCCDACGKDICGFSYHSEEDNLDLHICCRNLQDKLILMDETVFNLNTKVSSKCWWCKKKKISDGKRDVPGWAYSSTCNKYHLHVYCMTEMVHEAIMNMKNGGGDHLALDKVDLRDLLVKSKKKPRGSTVAQTIKSILKIILAVLLGDPTLLISNVLVELVERGLR